MIPENILKGLNEWEVSGDTDACIIPVSYIDSEAIKSEIESIGYDVKVGHTGMYFDLFLLLTITRKSIFIC